MLLKSSILEVSFEIPSTTRILEGSSAISKFFVEFSTS
jgi:hypothetical protein